MLTRALQTPGAWLAVVLGLAFSLMPVFGPFVAVVLLIGQPVTLSRLDALWILAATLSGIPGLINGGAQGLVQGAGPVVAAWLVYRAFSHLPAVRSDSRFRFLSLGLIIGLALSVFLGWLQNSSLDFAYRTAAQAISWETNPALYGHAVLVLGLGISLMVPFMWARIAALALAAFGVLVSGSREAGLAWLLFAVALPLVDASLRGTRKTLRYYGLVSVLLVFLAVLGSFLGWGRTGFLVDVVRLPTSEKNLIQNSEFSQSDYWRYYGVRVSDSALEFPDGPLTVFDITREIEDPSGRLQQVVNLESGQPYTVSAWIRSDSDANHFGIQGWTELRTGSTFAVTGIRQDGVWVARAGLPARILGSGVADTFGDWERYWFSFVYEGEQSPVQMFLGLAPDNRRVTGSTSQFAGFQLERGTEPTDYVPGTAVRGISLGSGRLPYWSAAWSGFFRSPIIGNAQEFAEYYLSLGFQRSRINEPPAHAHNGYLQELYTSGLVGFAGLVLLLIALGWQAYNRRDHVALLLLGVVLLINVFDTTFHYGGVLYPLAAVLGWRATILQRQSEHESARLARFLNGVSLGSAALLSPVLAIVATGLLVALRNVIIGNGFQLPPFITEPAVLYTCLLWPALAWREGLFPGHGISAPQQLKRQVTAAVLAGLIFAIIATQFPASYGLTFLRVVLIVLLAVVFLPVLQALTRRLLLRSGIWGEEVVILGTGAKARRALAALLDNPLSGLRPAALFSDDSSEVEGSVMGVPIVGSFDDSVSFARARDIHHAIIAVPDMQAEDVGHFMDVTGRRFKRAQFIPDLPGLPAEEVSASNIDGILAIEFNNGLFSVANQAAKRLMDLLGAGLLVLLLGLPLGVIYVLIRLDIHGSGFYVGKRVGKDGRVFGCLKFRTMVANADEQLPALLASSPALQEEYRRYHKLRNDPRVTRFGKFLRRYSLDELPQLINVLKGEMSLIGARPYLVNELPAMGRYSRIILQAKPGMTGLWQVSGRNELSFVERLELESHYVRNWTIWWDLIILADTAEVLAGRRQVSGAADRPS